MTSPQGRPWTIKMKLQPTSSIVLDINKKAPHTSFQIYPKNGAFFLK